MSAPVSGQYVCRKCGFELIVRVITSMGVGDDTRLIREECRNGCGVMDQLTERELIERLRQGLENANELLQAHHKDLADAAGELMVPMPEPGTTMAKLLRANRLMRKERDDARAAIERVCEVFSCEASDVVEVAREREADAMEPAHGVARALDGKQAVGNHPVALEVQRVVADLAEVRSERDAYDALFEPFRYVGQDDAGTPYEAAEEMAKVYPSMLGRTYALEQGLSDARKLLQATGEAVGGECIDWSEPEEWERLPTMMQAAMSGDLPEDHPTVAELAEARAALAAEQGRPEGAPSEGWRWGMCAAMPSGGWGRSADGNTAHVFRMGGHAVRWCWELRPTDRGQVHRPTLAHGKAPTARAAMRAADAATNEEK